MGTYLIRDVAQDVHGLCDTTVKGHRAIFSIPRAEIESPVAQGPGGHVLRVTMHAPEGFKSLLAILVVADMVSYAYALLQLPSEVTHYKFTPSGAAVSWVSIPPYLLTWLALTAVAPALALAGSRAVLDKREKRLADAIELTVGRKGGSITRLLPPQNPAIFTGDAALLLVAAGLFFALACLACLAWLGQAGLITIMVLPYLALILGALLLLAARNRMLRQSSESPDAQLMLRLNRMQLTGRVSYFFAFPLAFYGLICLGQVIGYGLALKQGIPTSLPRVHGNSMSINGMFIISGGEPQLQDQGQFDYFLAVKLLAPSSLDLALVGAVVAAIVMYLSAFRHWTILGIYSASGQFPIDRARPPDAPPLLVRRGRAAIIVQWAFMLLTNLAGAAVIVVIILWAAHQYLYGPVVERFIILPMSALAWYKTVVAIGLGKAAAEGFLALLILPGALCLLIWTYSLATRILLTARYLLPAGHDTTWRLSGIRSELRRITGCRPPRIYLDKRLSFPRTEAFLPFRRACVIRLPQHCADNLDDAQLLSVIAHEAVHAWKHARRLWWLESLSWLTITGPGLLTLLLDFTAMEFQADEIALRWTGDRRSAIAALEYFQDGQWAGSRRPRKRHGGPLIDIVGAVSRPLLVRFRTVFFESWAFQPGEELLSLQARVDKLTRHSV